MLRCVLSVAAMAVAACGSSDSLAPLEGGRVRALFELPREGAPPDDFYALPFPSDIRVVDGHPDMRDFPRPSRLLGSYADAVATLDGFGLNAPIHVRFSDAIDVRSLPATPEASLEDDAAVYLVDVDPDSPERGRRVPLRFRFEPKKGRTIGPNWLAALPYPGFPLAEGTTYALVVTYRLFAGGESVVPDFDFGIIAASNPDVDAAQAAARAAYAPLWDWLDEPGGDGRGDVVSAAVFTTQHATAIAGALRQAVRARPTPRAAGLTRVEPPAGATGIWTFTGTVAAPNFQRGEPPYNQAMTGDIVVDRAGVPVAQRDEALRISISVPARAAPAAGWPIAIVAHGTGGDYQSYLRDGTATRLAAQGIAAISTDQVLHGPRSPNASPDISFFNFENPQAARDNPLQGAADDFTLARLVETLVVATPSGNAGFDDGNIVFFGHSQGGLTGPPFVAYEPLVRGAVLSGAGGLLYYALLDKTEPIDIASIVDLAIGDDNLDEFNPTLALLQTWMERSDSVNYGPLLVRTPPRGSAPRPIFQTMGIVDHFTPLRTIAAFATSIGGNQVRPLVDAAPIEGLALRGREVLSAPVSRNLDGATAVLLQYPAAAGEDGHFVVFDVPAAQDQSMRFLATLTASGTATVEPGPR
jgi:hypothetical protein